MFLVWPLLSARVRLTLRLSLARLWVRLGMCLLWVLRLRMLRLGVGLLLRKFLRRRSLLNMRHGTGRLPFDIAGSRLLVQR